MRSIAFQERKFNKVYSLLVSLPLCFIPDIIFSDDSHTTCQNIIQNGDGERRRERRGKFMKLVPLKTGRTCQPVDSFVHHRIRRIPLPGERKLYNYPVNNYHDRCLRSSITRWTFPFTKHPIFNCARFSIRIIHLPFYFIEKFLLFSLSYKEENRSNPIRLNSIYIYKNRLLRKFVIPLLSIYRETLTIP